MRTNSRVFAFKLIFSSLFGTEIEDARNNLVEEEKLSSKDLEFANEIVEAFMDNKEDFSKELDEILEHYQRDRLFKVDLALLYLALAEMKCLKTPKAVVVNEVLEIAKKYSTEKSQKFINGVLAKTE